MLLRVKISACVDYFGTENTVGFDSDFPAGVYTPPPSSLPPAQNFAGEAPVKLIIARVATARLAVVWQD